MVESMPSVGTSSTRSTRLTHAPATSLRRIHLMLARTRSVSSGPVSAVDQFTSTRALCAWDHWMPLQVIYCLESDVELLLSTMLALFPPADATAQGFTNDIALVDYCLAAGPPADAYQAWSVAERRLAFLFLGPQIGACLGSLDASATLPREPGAITMVLSTRQGPGPQRLGGDDDVSLLNFDNGEPKAEVSARCIP